MTLQELFTKEISAQWDRLRQRDDTIFENTEISLSVEDKFNDLKENQQDFYFELLHENSTYERQKMLRQYFWDSIVGELYENTLNTLSEQGALDRVRESFEANYKLEKTAELILENGIFVNFDKKKEITESLLESFFYPGTFYEKNTPNFIKDLEEFSVSQKYQLEESFRQSVMNAGNAFGSAIVSSARLLKNLMIFFTFLLISPATLLMSNFGMHAVNKTAEWVTGEKQAIAPSPTYRKFLSFIDNFAFGIRQIYKFLNQDVYDVYKYLRKINTLDDQYIQDVMREVGANPNKLVLKCWDKYKYQVDSNSWWAKFKYLINGKGLANLLRNPLFNNELQLVALLKNDAGDPTYQKMFYDFRVCVYEKIFEIILGFAKAIYSIDDSSYEIIKYANEVHQSKNFKKFFDLRPKQENEEAMFTVVRVLVAIDAMANILEKRRGDLVADKYIDKFIDFLRQNIKQTYQELNELANQRQYNIDRYKEEEPTDEDKAKAIAQERFNAKKSIFED